MTIAFLADDVLKNEIIEKGISHSIELVWADSVSSLLMLEADAYFDLKFEMDKERTKRLGKLHPKPIFISAVNETLKQIGDEDFIRINAWPGMIKRSLIELAFVEGKSGVAKKVFDEIGWHYATTADIEGFITPRIIAMIINEAYFALGEGVSTKTEIDIAMKAGTNYPYGPFEWAEKIGLKNILALLISLYRNNTRYKPALMLSAELAYDLSD